MAISLFSNQVVRKALKNTTLVTARVTETVKITGLTALRVAKGERLDAVLLRETFEQLGTTYIKIGQFIASTPSLFPRDYVEAFQQCLDKTTPVPFAYIKQVIETELNQPLEQLFSEVNTTALASASIAQVHAATLVTGEAVVIKVQKPDVQMVMQTDLGVLHWASKLLEQLMPKMRFASIAPIIDEIRLRMLAETDFYQEAKNIADFQQFLQFSNNTNVVAPVVYQHASSRRVLTMQRLFGVPMTSVEHMRQYCTDPTQVLTHTLNTWFSSLMLCNSFHADLHAGNLLLLTDGRIGFIDFGIVGKLKPESWQACLGLVQAFQNNDYQAMADNMVQMGMTHDKQQVNTTQLAADLQSMLTKMLYANPNSMSVKDQADELNQIMLEMVQVGERHGIHFPRDFALLLKQLLYFDRFMQLISPDIQLFSDKRIDLMGQN